MCGDSGIIVKTSNSGSGWLIQQTGIYAEIGSIFFLNKDTGWATACVFNSDSTYYPGTIILKTTDGGDNWSKNMLPDTNDFYSNIYFLNSQKGFIGGVPDFVRYTTNGGISWINAIADSANINNLPIESISFINDQTGYSCGGSQDFLGIVWKTTNQGFNWKPFFLGIDAINDMYLFSPDTLFACSGDFKFGASYFKSNDAGSNWSNHNLGYIGKVRSIDFRTRNEGWMTIGYQQKLFLSTDRGSNWTISDPPFNASVLDICFPDSLNGWAACADGKILKYSVLVSVNENQTLSNKSFQLNQNFPNPFNPDTKINFNISEYANVSLIIYNLLGKEVMRLIDNKNYNPGSYSVNFSSENYFFPSGIYFYEMISGDKRQVKKMVLLK